MCSPRFHSRIDLAICWLTVLLALLLPLWRRGVSVVAPLVIVLWLVNGTPWRRRHELLHSRTSVAVLLFILLNLVALLWSSNLAEAWDYIGKYRYLLLVPAIATTLGGRFIRPVLNAFLAGTTISVLWSYGLYLGLVHVGRNYPEHPAPTMSHLDYSMFLAFAALLVLHLALQRPLPWSRRLLWLLLFVLVTGGLFINIGRSGQLAFFGALLVLLPGHLPVRPWLRPLLTCGTVALLLVLVYTTVPVFQHRADAAVHEISSVINEQQYSTNQGKRIACMIVAAAIFREHPVLGTGPADNMVELRRLLAGPYRYLEEHIGDFPHLHNQYLQTGTELGLVGLLSLAAIFVQLLRERPDCFALRGVAIVLAWVFLFGFLGDPFFHKQLPVSLFALMAGLVCTATSPEGKSRWPRTTAPQPEHLS